MRPRLIAVDDESLEDLDSLPDAASMRPRLIAVDDSALAPVQTSAPSLQ